MQPSHKPARTSPAKAVPWVTIHCTRRAWCRVTRQLHSLTFAHWEGCMRSYAADSQNGTRLVGADDTDGEALLAGQQQRLVHLLEFLVEGLDLAHALVARQVAPAAARVQKPFPLVLVVLIPTWLPPSDCTAYILLVAFREMACGT